MKNDQKLSPSIHSFDVFANWIEKEAFNLDIGHKMNMDKKSILEGKTIELIKNLLETKNTNEEKLKVSSRDGNFNKKKID